MKRRRTTTVIVVVILLLIILGGKLFINSIVDKALRVPLCTPKLTTLKDGVYEGSYTLSPVNVQVRVTVKNNRMEVIDILKHDHGLGGPAEQISDDVLQKQSLDVDVISGSTISSKCILKAIETALHQAQSTI